MANIVITNLGNGVLVEFNDQSSKFGIPEIGLRNSNFDIENVDDLCVMISTNTGKKFTFSYDENSKWGKVDTINAVPITTNAILFDEFYKLLQ